MSQDQQYTRQSISYSQSIILQQEPELESNRLSFNPTEKVQIEQQSDPCFLCGAFSQKQTVVAHQEQYNTSNSIIKTPDRQPQNLFRNSITKGNSGDIYNENIIVKSPYSPNFPLCNEIRTSPQNQLDNSQISAFRDKPNFQFNFEQYKQNQVTQLKYGRNKFVLAYFTQSKLNGINQLEYLASQFKYQSVLNIKFSEQNYLNYESQLNRECLFSLELLINFENDNDSRKLEFKSTNNVVQSNNIREFKQRQFDAYIINTINNYQSGDYIQCPNMEKQFLNFLEFILTDMVFYNFYSGLTMILPKQILIGEISDLVGQILFENPKINCRKYGDISFGIQFEAVYKNDKIEFILLHFGKNRKQFNYTMEKEWLAKKIFNMTNEYETIYDSHITLISKIIKSTFMKNIFLALLELNEFKINQAQKSINKKENQLAFITEAWQAHMDILYKRQIIPNSKVKDYFIDVFLKCCASISEFSQKDNSILDESQDTAYYIPGEVNLEYRNSDSGRDLIQIDKNFNLYSNRKTVGQAESISEKQIQSLACSNGFQNNKLTDSLQIDDPSLDSYPIQTISPSDIQSSDNSYLDSNLQDNQLDFADSIHSSVSQTRQSYNIQNESAPIYRLSTKSQPSNQFYD